MLLNVPDASLLVAQPFGRVVPTQFLDEFFGATGDVPRKVDGVDTLHRKKNHHVLVNTNANQGFSLIVYWSSFFKWLRSATDTLPSFLNQTFTWNKPNNTGLELLFLNK